MRRPAGKQPGWTLGSEPSLLGVLRLVNYSKGTVAEYKLFDEPENLPSLVDPLAIAAAFSSAALVR